MHYTLTETRNGYTVETEYNAKIEVTDAPLCGAEKVTFYMPSNLTDAERADFAEHRALCLSELHGRPVQIGAARVDTLEGRLVYEFVSAK